MTTKRAYSEGYGRTATESKVECIHATYFLPVPDNQLKELQRETACDPALQFVKKAILDGFPDTKDGLPVAIKRYFEIQDYLSLHDGVIFKGQRCIIPQILRQKIKQKLRDSHIGSGCVCRVRETVYWPGMNAEITDYIQKCDVCMSLQSNQTKEPLICHEPTSRPWEKVATDIFTLDDENYLCIVDYYSGYYSSGSVTQPSRNCHHKETWRHFVTHGTPNELLSGNEPPFNSAEFEIFLRSSDTEHVTSSPATPKAMDE